MNAGGNSSVFSRAAAEFFLRRSVALMGLVVGVTIVVAVCQSREFSISLWAVPSAGMGEWREYVNAVLGHLPPWAFATGIVFVMEYARIAPPMDPKKWIRNMAAQFFLGVLWPYVSVVAFAFIYYIPLGIASFLFPGHFVFTSAGFAVLCAAVTVFLLIMVDMPGVLIFWIRFGKNPFFRLTAILGILLLAVQIASTVLLAPKIVLEYGVWRRDMYAYILGALVSMVSSAGVVLAAFRRAHWKTKILLIAAVYVLSVFSANLLAESAAVGELGASVAALLPFPLLYALMLRRMSANPVGWTFAFEGTVLGVGIGLGIAHWIHLRVIGEGVFGVCCGTSIAAGFGISFGFIFGPRIVEAIDALLRIGIENTMMMGFGMISGILGGTVIGGFLHR
jgi:hypothetical protein